MLQSKHLQHVSHSRFALKAPRSSALLPRANKNNRLTLAHNMHNKHLKSKTHQGPNLSRKPWTRPHQPLPSKGWGHARMTTWQRMSGHDALSSTVSYFVNNIPSIPRGFLSEDGNELSTYMESVMIHAISWPSDSLLNSKVHKALNVSKKWMVRPCRHKTNIFFLRTSNTI